MRIVDDLVACVDGRQARVRAVESRQPFGTGARLDDRAHLAHDPLTLGAAGVLKRHEIGTLDPLAEGDPELGFERAEREPLAVGGFVHRVAGALEIGGRRAHRPVQRRLVNRYVDRGAPAGPLAVKQRTEDAGRGLHRRADVADERAGQLLFRASGACRRTHQQPGQRLVVDVVRRALNVGATRAEAGNRRADQPRMTRAKTRRVDAQPARRRRAEALDEHVARRDQLVEHRMRLRDRKSSVTLRLLRLSTSK
jgi:hypothetical protein